MNIGKSLNVALAMNDMNGKDLAKAIETTESTISNLKQGRTRNIQLVAKIADYFGMSVSEFIALGEK